MKIFSIGNSFSDDMTACINPVSIAGGNEFKSINIYYPACTLEQHINFYNNNEAAYNLEINGVITPKKVTLVEMITADKYDVVTVQQGSHLSGVKESYEPYLPMLLDIVKKYQPDAKIAFHQTWTYETDYKSENFEKYYGNSQTKMYECVKECSEYACRKYGLIMIPVGEVINRMRKLPFFDYANGGKSANRDGLHLDTTYSRMAAAYTLFETLTGYDSRDNFCSKFTAKAEVMAEIKNIVHDTVSGYGKNFNG